MKRKFQFRSIKTRIIAFITLIVVFACAGLALISYSLASSALEQSVDDSMSQIALQASNLVTARVNMYYQELTALTTNDVFRDISKNKGEVLTILQREAALAGHENMLIADTNGNAYTMKNERSDESDRDFFKKAIAGTNTISDPTQSKYDDSMQVYIAVPIKDKSGAVIGIIAACRDATELSNMIADVTFGKTGKAYMLNGQGTAIAHYLPEMVLNMDNKIEQVKSDPSFTELASVQQKMINGETGVGQYAYQGEIKYMSYHPVEGLGWSIALTAPKSEVLAAITTLSLMIGGVSIILIVVSIFIGILLARSISVPIKMAADSAQTLASGDFTIEVPEEFAARTDEIGTLAAGFKALIESLNRAFTNINSAAEQVASGSKQVSESSIALSQGATEQASSIEQLTASIEQISAQTRQNADNAKEVNNLAEITKNSADNGFARMSDMLKAMDEINSSSSNISKIIKVIDDIAFQTNILALNAAVEAARAGQQGKGFAVVAEEVRNLAARSANAANETTAMIEGSIKKVTDGTKIANETSDALKSIVDGIQKVSDLVGSIAVASEEQSAGIGQINQGITQVSSVVQANSATSEESAASSEELSSQAELLKEQVSWFNLKKLSAAELGLSDVEQSNPGLPDPAWGKNMEESPASSDKTPKDSRKIISLNDNEFGKY